MDNFFDKIGIYDFFGFPESNTLKGILFIFLSYILGAMIQELSSWADDGLFGIRKKRGGHSLMMRALTGRN